MKTTIWYIVLLFESRKVCTYPNWLLSDSSVLYRPRSRVRMTTIARQTELKMGAEKGQSSQERNRTDCKGPLSQGLCSWIRSQGTRLNTQTCLFMLPCFCSPETPSKHSLLCSPSQPRTQCICLDVLDPTVTLSASVSPTSFHILTMVS